MPLRVLIGSTRPAKVDALREALALIATHDRRFAIAEIEPVDVGDAAPRMPMSEAEVLAGARSRAGALLTRRAAAGDVCVGLEGGLDAVALPGGGTAHVLRSWACVTDGRHWSYGAGPALVLPDGVVREVVAGAELGDVIDRRAGAPVRSTRGAWGVLTRDLIGRRDAFRLAIVAAMAPFYNPRPWGD